MHKVYRRRVCPVLDNVLMHKLIDLIQGHPNFTIIHSMLKSTCSQISSYFESFNLVRIHYINWTFKGGELLVLFANVWWTNNMGGYW